MLLWTRGCVPFDVVQYLNFSSDQDRADTQTGHVIDTNKELNVNQ